ncbi:uncharacterized protein MYCGRDRAFT_104334 [Zymoseptoria tritici IPO323]|uniref:Uncharacterized protein n=1 Tax=Zymoseptoria tritici (strain CBS 115943 / IPO323) TaxID=336722 RepID=F9XAH8_ZYMTI|nr:uncharacterized protein MYCGRDRAFT_104334 [Zymoseptoria tritici IPO323]EGP87762.1 hypothetical protein MYCGRDRAFT_104334 [Zymoseptoria tritici IPO323]
MHRGPIAQLANHKSRFNLRQLGLGSVRSLDRQIVRILIKVKQLCRLHRTMPGWELETLQIALRSYPASSGSAHRV